MATILETHNLRKEFGGLIAVSDVSIQIEQGSLHSIIGPNGAGKTTFFNLLSGKYKPTSGQIFLSGKFEATRGQVLVDGKYKPAQGKDITDLPFHERIHLGIGRSFQVTNIFPNLTVLENVRLAAQAVSSVKFAFWRNANSYTDLHERAASVLETVGLGDMLAVPANALPHGGKRKLELAILLAPEPEILLLDEPTAGMASEQVPELIDIIANLRHSHNKTIVMVEHNMSVVMGISDRITVMNMGEMLAEGTPTEIANNDRVQSVYLGTLYGDVNEMTKEG